MLDLHLLENGLGARVRRLAVAAARLVFALLSARSATLLTTPCATASSPRSNASRLPAVFAQEITAAITSHTQQGGLDLNVIILMCWSEAQSDAKVKKLVSGFQLKYREALVGIVRKWQKDGYVARKGDAEEIGKALLSFFLGFIVQSALLGRIDPDTAARGIDGLIGRTQVRNHHS